MPISLNVTKKKKKKKCPLDDVSRSQAQRLKKHGGFGIRSSELHASGAYISSVTFGAKQDSWEPQGAEGFEDAVHDFNNALGITVLDRTTGSITNSQQDNRPTSNDIEADLPEGTYASEKYTVPRQKQLSHIISEHEFGQAFYNADIKTRTRWISQSGKGAGDWAFSTPSKDLGFAFTPAEFRALVRWWLGAQLVPSVQPCPMEKCKMSIGLDGDHALVCKSGHGIMARHNSLCLQFAQECSKAQLAPQREKTLGNHGPGGGLTRPGDVYLPNYDLGTALVLDFAVTHVQQNKYTDLVRTATWVKAGSFAERYASEHKISERAEAVAAGHRFEAMVVESFGSWSKSALTIIKSVGKHRASTSNGTLSHAQATAQLIRGMNIALMRSQARMLVRRLPDEDPTGQLVTHDDRLDSFRTGRLRP